MTDFLIKSTLSLFVLLAVYHLVLEKEKMHKFNRFYLLFSIVFSFAIPFITIEVIDETANAITQTNTVFTDGATTNMITAAETVDYTPIILWSIYSLITGILLFRFVRNIAKINSSIKSNTIVDYKEAKLVLLEEETLPHTFLNYIFINETDYHNRKIERELYTHELIHVTQKHTLDILFMEIIKMIFWFNPIFIFYKKAIQLNHEFLADEKVVNSYKNVPFYQSLLISKANVNTTYYLASNLNYSVTKKRLIMMTKTTSESMAALKKLLLLPLFSGLIFFMCVESVAQEKPTASPKKTTQSDQQGDTYSPGARVIVKDHNKKTIIDKKYEELTSSEKKKFFNNVPPPNNLKEITITLKQNNDIGSVAIISDKKDKAQPIVNNDNTVYNLATIETKPDFPGGMEKFYQFIGKNYKVPEVPKEPKLKGKVYISFIIEKDGSLSEIKSMRDIGHGTGEEAIRVLKSCPKWIAGKIKGEPVRVLYQLPIAIQS